MRTTLVAGALALAAVAAPATASAKDTNHDRIPDRWERAYHLSLKVDQSKRDQDHDGLRNRAEWRERTDPRDADTDADGLPDARDEQPTEASDTPEPPAAPEAPQPPHTDAPGPGRVVSYEQSAGFGGFLTLERANGERVTAYFGEKTELDCGDAACTKDHLVAGAAVAAAQHSVNERGFD